MLRSPCPFGAPLTERKTRLNEDEKLNQKSASKRDQRKFIYSAEREQIQARKAGLKEKGERRKEKSEKTRQDTL